MSSLLPVTIGLAAGIVLIVIFGLMQSYSVALETHCRIGDLGSILEPIKKGTLALMITEKTTSKSTFPEVSLISYLKHQELREVTTNTDLCYRIANRTGQEDSFMSRVRITYWTYLDLAKATQLVKDPSLHFAEHFEQGVIRPSNAFTTYETIISIQGKDTYYITVTLPNLPE